MFGNQSYVVFRNEWKERFDNKVKNGQRTNIALGMMFKDFTKFRKMLTE